MGTGEGIDRARLQKINGAGIKLMPQYFTAQNEALMTDDEFRLFRDLIQDECGIFLSESKRDFLRARVKKRKECLRIKSYFNYYKFINNQTNREELYEFLDSVTINETYFFRNTPQFEMFRINVLPAIIEKKRRLRDCTLSIWSAGCSTGEEPYSIAIEVLEALPDASLWDIKVIASDLSLRCLETAIKGIYQKDKLRDAPVSYISKYFKQIGTQYEVRDIAKKIVMFDYHNLKYENGIENMDIIFCRNVMIYFDMDEQKQLIARFQRVLKKEGYLFLGHAETLQGIPNGDFRFLYWNKGTAYQKVGSDD